MNSIQDKLQKASAGIQRKYQDIHLHHLGNSHSLIRINLHEDKWSNSEYEITTNDNITAFINFAGNEIPITDLLGDNSDDTGKGIHLYDILPIEGYFKFEDTISLKDIFIMKVEVTESIYKVAILQAVDRVAKFSNTSLVWIKYILSPTTLQMDLYPELIEIIDAYKSSDWLPEYANEEWEG